MANLEGRHAYALLYRTRPGPEADAVTQQHEEQERRLYAGESAKGEGVARWAFETWPDSLDTTEKNEYLCIIWTERGSVRVDGACSMTDTRLHFAYKKNNSNGWVDLAKPASTMLGRRLIAADCQRVAKVLKPKIEDIWNAAEELDDDARRIHLSTLAGLLQG